MKFARKKKWGPPLKTVPDIIQSLQEERVDTITSHYVGDVTSQRIVKGK